VRERVGKTKNKSTHVIGGELIVKVGGPFCFEANTLISNIGFFLFKLL